MYLGAALKKQVDERCWELFLVKWAWCYCADVISSMLQVHCPVNMSLYSLQLMLHRGVYEIITSLSYIESGASFYKVFIQ